MARQTHIVSFDDAKNRSRAERAARSSSGSSRRTSSVGATARQGLSATSYRDSSQQDEGRSEPEVLDARERRRRERAKARADKMFTRQFSGETAAVEQEGAPRAALYEGKMGSAHRKSTRMQRSSAAVPVSAKLNPGGWLSGLVLSARSMRVATVVLCVALTCAFLYVPAKQYYQAERERAQLAAEYSVIEQRNDTLDAQNDALASDAGMEDAVRGKYGYVKQGEQTAIVTGLSDATTDSSRDSDGIEANVLSSSVKAPEEWYTPLLDAFFGVE